MIPVVVIFGYNNTRIADVKHIGNLAKELFNAKLVLCKDEITEVDRTIADYTIAIPLVFQNTKTLEENCSILDDFLKNNNLKPIGCLPFSDRGVVMGSFYAKTKDLKHDDPQKGVAGIDKATFREYENSINLPSWYKKPLFLKVNSFEDARAFIEKAGKKLFIKPTCEGNSRGCFAIESVKDLDSYKEVLEKYWIDGVIIEEYIQDCHEYSFESINDFNVLTEKKTTDGHFRVEVQHILPAPLNASAYARLTLAGREVGKIVGSNKGAEHNELFLHPSGLVYCVEPNRRPAGMKIWDMIQIAFEFDMYKAWLNWACNGKEAVNYPVHNKYFVGYRMIKANKSGILKDYSTDLPSEIIGNIVTLNITKPKNSTISNELKDNSDGIGYVIAKHENADELRTLLEKVENIITSNLEIS